MAAVRLRLFAAARETAGCSEATFDVADLASLRVAIVDAYGEEFARVLGSARLWVNGDEPSGGDATVLNAGDEVAVVPPVSGG